MMRKKVKLMWIERNKCKHLELAEEVSEINKACGVSAFVIMYGRGDTEPVMWPSRPEIERLLKRYESFPEAERYEEMTTPEALPPGKESRTRRTKQRCAKIPVSSLYNVESQ
ncbi:hypothetical protein ACJRO7_007685 [Eucalyptus globulus]|uniref:MADS-box domain-containing protein n=1 Tax=Eucalyptus globulus TaxID=34317 RepID=A0ABD3ILZ3_EUCGL